MIPLFCKVHSRETPKLSLSEQSIIWFLDKSVGILRGRCKKRKSHFKIFPLLVEATTEITNIGIVSHTMTKGFNIPSWSNNVARGVAQMWSTCSYLWEIKIKEILSCWKISLCKQWPSIRLRPSFKSSIASEGEGLWVTVAAENHLHW